MIFWEMLNSLCSNTAIFKDLILMVGVMSNESVLTFHHICDAETFKYVVSFLTWVKIVNWPASKASETQMSIEIQVHRMSFISFAL